MAKRAIRIEELTYQQPDNLVMIRSEDVRLALKQMVTKNPFVLNYAEGNLIAGVFEFFVTRFNKDHLVGDIDLSRPMRLSFIGRLEFLAMAGLQVHMLNRLVFLYNRNMYIGHNFVYMMNSYFYLDRFDEYVEASIVNSTRDSTFKGARAMQLPFKEAVERHIVSTYGNRLQLGLTLADIFREDKALYQAINSYKKRFGLTPFDLPSVRDIAAERFQRVVDEGMKNASRRDRDAAHRIARRITRRLDPT